ncbi:hypothetical protein RND71_041619 [Anisodus tanguticus]|uniref:GH10 domain-containing protein n=1 Tax=Anisodus tanguticus TaxID=243964 RepID=A0AAE1QY26_9SOLA|nr:hypothetical protein RND71_041619 [Anisodus tanguticus]
MTLLKRIRCGERNLPQAMSLDTSPQRHDEHDTAGAESHMWTDPSPRRKPTLFLTPLRRANLWPRLFDMDIMKRENLVLVLYYLLLASTGFEVYAENYDYSYTVGCLRKPLKPQYNGGIVVNPEFNDGLKGWFLVGDAKIENNVSSDGNKFIVASERKGSYHGFSQMFQLDKEKFYVVSGWVQVNHGDDANVAVIFKTQGGFQHAAWTIAKSGCWSMFKGGLVVNVSGSAQLYFEINNTAIDIWADSISVKSFSQEEWTSHQNQTIKQVRKSKVAIQVVDSQGKPLPNAAIALVQGRANFPFGVAINRNILNNKAYQNWFFSRFKFTVFEDEMKWYSTETSQGKIDYSTSDEMVKLCKSNGVSIRGHNILWDDPKFQPNWVSSLSPQQLSAAAGKRIGSVIAKYKGQVIHWDVVNENLHFNFFEGKLGPNASAIFYRLAAQFDNKTPLFLNDYNTIEDQRDGESSPRNYLNKIRQLRMGYRGPLGIGLEGHFVTPSQPYIRAAIDTLASARLPVWITELDVQSSPNQAQFLDQIIKEVVGHPAVQGLIIWSAWKPTGCYRMCLTDNNFINLPTGNVVDKARATLSHEGLVGSTNAEGYFETSLFHGDYKAIVTHPSMADSSFHHNLTVIPTTSEISVPPISELGPDALLEPMAVDDLYKAFSKKKIGCG